MYFSTYLVIFLLKACSAGWHGKNCKHRCSNWHCKQNASCNHVTGLCEEGCAAGWKGSICDESNSISTNNLFFFLLISSKGIKVNVY